VRSINLTLNINKQMSILLFYINYKYQLVHKTILKHEQQIGTNGNPQWPRELNQEPILPQLLNKPNYKFLIVVRVLARFKSQRERSPVFIWSICIIGTAFHSVLVACETSRRLSQRHVFVQHTEVYVKLPPLRVLLTKPESVIFCQKTFLASHE